MANPEQKYFVSVEVTWGKEAADGTQTVESRGGQNWGALDYAQSVAVQTAVVMPGAVVMLDEAGKLGVEGVEMMGLEVPDSVKGKGNKR